MPLITTRPYRLHNLRDLFREMNIGYTIQQDWKTGEETGFYCIATSHLRKDNAMQRISVFLFTQDLPYTVTDGSGLTFYVHEK